MTYRPQLGLSNFRYFDAFCSKNGLSKLIFNDLSAVTFTSTTFQPFGTLTFTQTEDEATMDLDANATAGTRVWWESFQLPSSTVQKLFIGYHQSSINTISGTPTMTVWCQVPPATFTAGTIDVLYAGTSALALNKVVNGTTTQLSSAEIALDDSYNIFMLNRTDSFLRVGNSPHGRKIVHTSDIAYPADAVLTNMQYAGFQINVAVSTHAVFRASAPFLVGWSN